MSLLGYLLAAPIIILVSLAVYSLLTAVVLQFRAAKTLWIAWPRSFFTSCAAMCAGCLVFVALCRWMGIITTFLMFVFPQLGFFNNGMKRIREAANAQGRVAQWHREDGIPYDASRYVHVRGADLVGQMLSLIGIPILLGLPWM